MASQLVQIYYLNAHLPHLFPFAVPYFNEELTMFYENAVICKVVSETKADKIAVCSWKLRSKLRWNMPGPTKARELTQNVIDSDYEVLSFTRNSEHHDMLGAAEVWHPGFNKIFLQMLEAAGIPRPWKVRTPIYQNAFSAKTTIYRDYIKTYLIPAMSVLSSSLKDSAMSDSHYSKLVRDVDPEYLQSKLGVPWTPLAPFLLERLFSVYVQNKGIKVTQL